MKVAGFALLFFLAVALLVIVAGQMGLLKGKTPTDLGVHDGKLKPPSATPNSVSSQADLYPHHPQRSYASIAPLRFEGEAPAAMERLRQVLQAHPGVSLQKQEANYLYAVARTPLLRFADDLEFWIPPGQQFIHMRSASRLGRKDMGANRTRLEAIRVQFEKT